MYQGNISLDMWKFQRPPYNLHVPNLNIKPILKFYWFSNTAALFTISLKWLCLYLCICHIASWWVYRDKFRQFLIKVNSKFQYESTYESVLHVYSVSICVSKCILYTLRNHRILYTRIQIAFYFAYNLLVCSEFEEY